MRAIGHNIRWTRRCALLGSTVLLLPVLLQPLQADTHADAVDLFASMAAALSANNAPEFMNAFHRDMPDYDKLKTQIGALLNEAEISSSVEPLNDEGDEAKRTAELDWYLEIRSLTPNGPLVRRRDVIRCELRKDKKQWKIVSLKPIEFFAPAKLDK